MQAEAKRLAGYAAAVGAIGAAGSAEAVVQYGELELVLLEFPGPVETPAPFPLVNEFDGDFQSYGLNVPGYGAAFEVSTGRFSMNFFTRSPSDGHMLSFYGGVIDPGYMITIAGLAASPCNTFGQIFDERVREGANDGTLAGCSPDGTTFAFENDLPATGPFSIETFVPFSGSTDGVGEVVGYLDVLLEGDMDISNDSQEPGRYTRVTVREGRYAFLAEGMEGDLKLTTPNRGGAEVPLPAALPLLAAGVAGLAALRCGRRAAA